MDAMPFTNYVVKIEVSGEALLKALENGVSEIEKSAGRFAQVSGMTYSFNPDLPAGSRIVKSSIGGQQIDPNKTYTLATVDFIANGGDGYEMFKGTKVLLDANAGPLLSGLIIDTIQKAGTIAPKADGRIMVSKEEPTAEPVVPSEPTEPTVSTVSEIIYTVRKNDWLSKIAPKYGLTWQELAAYNSLSNPDHIVVGQKLRIPVKG